MARRSRRAVDDEDDEDDEEEQNSSTQDDDEQPPPRRRRRAEASQDEEEEADDSQDGGGFALSQQPPDESQSVLPERAGDRRNLEEMDDTARANAILALSRLILFRALEREPIDRTKILKDAGLGGERISTAVFQEVAARLRNCFGFDLRRLPKYMEKMKGLPAKYKDRYFVVNLISEDSPEARFRALDSKHAATKIENGTLILTLALIFCKGEARSDGSRWILARDLYRLLHQIDEAIPRDPPAQGTARSKVNVHGRIDGPGVSSTPNIDILLEKFVAWDYLIREKATEENFTTQALEEGDMLYTMGPRSGIEIGKRQIVCFCAEILDEEPDPTMLQEIDTESEAHGEGGAPLEASQES